MSNGDGVALDQSTFKPIQLDQSTYRPLQSDAGSSPGFLGSALKAAAAGLSPVPTDWYGKAWNAITDPTGAGLDAVKSAARGLFALPSWQAPSLASVTQAPPALQAVTGAAKGLWQSEVAQAGRAREAAASGDLARSWGQEMALAVPVLGPMMGAATERYRQASQAGDQPAAGEALGQALSVPLSLAQPEVAEAALGRLGTVAKPLAGSLADTMAEKLPGAATAPAADMTRADMVNAAQDMGVNLPLGKATGSGMLKGAESLAENSLFGARRMEQLAANNQAALNNKWDELLTQADPGNVGATKELAGQNLKDQAQPVFGVDKQAVNAGYDQMEPLIPRIGRIGLADLEDFGRNKMVDPQTGEITILPADLSKAANEALDVRRISGRSTPQLVGAGSTLPAAAPGGGGVRPDLSAAMPAGAAIDGLDGDSFVLKTPGGDMPGVYRVVKGQDLQASHDPRTFQPNPDFPAGVQERDYTDRAAQARVENQVQTFDPNFILNNNPDAINGPTVIWPDGKIAGGTSRYVTVERVYNVGRGDEYLQPLVDRAAQFGIDAAQIPGAQARPQLVRQLLQMPETVDDARRVVSDLNRPFTAALNPAERAVSAGRSITPGTLNAIGGMFEGMGDDATLNDLLDSKRNARDVWSLMERDGVVSQQDAGRYWDMPADRFTPEGRQFVRNALLGSAVDDVGLLQRAPDSLLSRVGRTLPQMAPLMARGDEWDVSPLVRQALNEHANLNAQGLTLDDYLRQSRMFGEQPNPAVTAVMQRLGEAGPGYKNALGQFASDASADVPGQAMLAGAAKPEAWQSFNDVFGTKLNKQQYNEALVDAKTGGLSGIQQAGVRQVPAAVGQAGISGGVRLASAGAGTGGTAAAGAGGPDLGPAQDRGTGAAGTGPGASAAGAGGVGGAESAGGAAAAADLTAANSVNWRSARQIRSYFFDKANDFTGPVRDELRGMYAEMTKRMDNAMGQAAREAGPDVEETWRQANDRYRQFQDDWNGAGSALKPLVTTPDTQLERLTDKYLNGSPKMIRDLQAKGIDLAGLQQQALNDIAAGKFSIRGDKLAGYSDDFLRTLFADKPQMVDDLYKFGAVKRALGEQFNPSGSGRLMALYAQAGSLFGGAPAEMVAGHPGAAALTAAGVAVPSMMAPVVTSPRLFRYLTQPRGAIGAAISPQAAAGWRAAQVLRQQQDQNQGQ